MALQDTFLTLHFWVNCLVDKFYLGIKKPPKPKVMVVKLSLRRILPRKQTNIREYRTLVVDTFRFAVGKEPECLPTRRWRWIRTRALNAVEAPMGHRGKVTVAFCG